MHCWGWGWPAWQPEVSGSAGVSARALVQKQRQWLSHPAPSTNLINRIACKPTATLTFYMPYHSPFSQEHRLELGKDVDLGQYVASGVVVFDLHRRSVKWSQHLDLSTDHTSFKAYAYSGGLSWSVCGV